MNKHVSRTPPQPCPTSPTPDGQGRTDRLFLGLYFPFLATDRLGRMGCDGKPEPKTGSSAATVCVEKQRGALRIVAADATAMAAGLAPGLALAEARARVPDVIVRDANPAADMAWLRRIADICDRYTPLVALDPPDALLLDITGVDHLFGGPAGLIDDVRAHMARTGMTMRHGLAATPEAAWALARYGGEEISALPVAALRLGTQTHTALRRAGLKTIGDLASRPTAPLTARFGADATAMLERMLGRADSRITPIRTVAEIIVARRFAEPVTHRSNVLASIAAMVADASGQLEHRGLGGRTFALRLFRSDGAICSLNVSTSRPERKSSVVMRLFAEQVGALADPLDPGFGFDLMRLSVPQTEPLGTTQLTLDDAASGQSMQGDTLTSLVDRLAARVGRGRIRRLIPIDSHVPEQGVIAVPSMDRPPPQIQSPRPANPRPVHLFDPPQRVTVIAEVPDGAPQRFRWRGRLHEVVRAEGPERIATPWWQERPSGLTRDYYRVEDSQGRRYWLFRHGLYDRETAQPAWYVHGVFA